MQKMHKNRWSKVVRDFASVPTHYSLYINIFIRLVVVVWGTQVLSKLPALVLTLLHVSNSATFCVQQTVHSLVSGGSLDSLLRTHCTRWTICSLIAYSPSVCYTRYGGKIADHRGQFQKPLT